MPQLTPNSAPPGPTCKQHPGDKDYFMLSASEVKSWVSAFNTSSLFLKILTFRITEKEQVCQGLTEQEDRAGVLS